MPYELLERLRCTQLPTKIDDPDEIDKLVTLRTAGLIDVDFPASQQGGGHRSWCGNAIVMRVTPKGAWLSKGEPIADINCRGWASPSHGPDIDQGKTRARTSHDEPALLR
jgi:hypothetical protein